MVLKLHHSALVRGLVLLLQLFSPALSTPILGVSRETLSGPYSNGYQSYSAIIQFDDASIPGDAGIMTDAQFINLAMIGYNEMIVGCSSSATLCPGAMVALESGGRIYFASSIKSAVPVAYPSVDYNMALAPGWWMSRCVDNDVGFLTANGACAEPHMVYLYGNANGVSNQQLLTPPTNATNPRVAVWGRPDSAGPGDGQETYYSVCNETIKGWGCLQLTAGWHPVSSTTPDATDEDDWKFNTLDSASTVSTCLS